MNLNEDTIEEKYESLQYKDTTSVYIKGNSSIRLFKSHKSFEKKPIRVAH